MQEQPLEVLYKGSFSQKICKIHRKIHLLESLFYQKEMSYPVNFWITAFFIEHLRATASVNLYLLEFGSVFSLFSSKVDHN